MTNLRLDHLVVGGSFGIRSRLSLVSHQDFMVDQCCGYARFVIDTVVLLQSCQVLLFDRERKQFFRSRVIGLCEDRFVGQIGPLVGSHGRLNLIRC